MRYSQKWWVIVALLLAFALTVSVLTAQTETPSAVNTPSSAEVQSDSVKAQPSSDEPKQKQPTLELNRDTAFAADVETERLFNELRRELLDDRAKAIDDRAKMIDRWLEATAIFLTLLGVAAAILGYFGFKRLDRIEGEARENMEESERHAQEAQRYVEEIRAKRDEADSSLKGINAKIAGDDPAKASEVVESVKQNPDSTLINQAVAVAISLQQQSKVKEAIEKWRSIANTAEGTDNDLAARAWFSVGYLTSPKNTPGEDFGEAVKAYDKVIELDPSYAVAYFNRGNAKASLDQTEAAIDDYDAAIGLNASYAVAYFNRGNAKAQLAHIDEARRDFEMVLNLAQAAGNTDLMIQARAALGNLDKGDVP